MGLQQPFHLESQRGVGAAGLVQIIRPLRRRFLLERGEEDRFHPRRTGHSIAPILKDPSLNATKPVGTPPLKRITRKLGIEEQ